jgi:hypothetical protein
VGTGLWAYPSSFNVFDTCGSAAPVEFTLTNYASTPADWSLVTDQLNPSQPNAPVEPSPYFAASPTSGTLAPGAAQTIAISLTSVPFYRDANIVPIAEVVITSDLPSSLPLTVQVNVSESGLNLAGNGLPTSYDFGDVALDRQGTFLIPYDDVPPLVMGPLSEPPFSLSGPNPNSSFDNWIFTFEPTTPGTFTSAFQYRPGPGSFNLTVCPPGTLTLTGVGVEPGSENPDGGADGE